MVLSIVLLGLLKGKTSIEACARFTNLRRCWFNGWFRPLPRGIPNPTTIVRVLSITQPQDVITAVNRFFDRLINDLEKSMSLDGKTIKAIHTCKDQCVAHNGHRIYGQKQALWLAYHIKIIIFDLYFC